MSAAVRMIEPMSPPPPGDGHDPDDFIERLAGTIIAHGPASETDPQTARLLAGLIVCSGINLPLKSLLAAVSPDRPLIGTGDVEAVMGRLGFHIRRGHASDIGDVSVERTWGLLLPRSAAPAVLVRAGGDWLLLAGDGSVARLDPESPDATRGDFVHFDFESEDHALSRSRRIHTGHSWLRALVERMGPMAVSLLINSLVIAFASVLLPLSIAVFFDQIVGRSSAAAVLFLFGSFLLIALVKLLAMRHRARAIAWIASRLDYLVASVSFRTILRLSPMLSERAAPHAQAARLRSFDSFRDYLMSPQATQLLEFPAAAMSVVVVAALSANVALVPIAGIGAMLVLYVIARRWTRVQTGLAAEEATELQRIAIETVEKRETIRMLGMQAVWAARLDRATRREMRSQQRLAMTGAVAEAVSGYIYSLTLIGMMVAGAWSVWSATISAGMLLPIAVLTMRALAPFHALCLSVLRIEQIRRSFHQINEFMDLPAESPSGQERRRPPAVTGAIGFSNIAFRTGDRQPVFAGLDLDVASGELIGISGAAGSGKSTVLKMVLGMVDTPIGALRIDGVDSRQLPLLELRRRISYVPQSPVLLPGSLADNLYYANPLASRQQFDDVVEWSGLGAIAAGLPGGLDFAAENPEDPRLTADLRFRLAFAQARLVNSRLLLVDEFPNSLVDGPLGGLLRAEIIRSRGRRTVLFVSHRSDLLSLADRVVALRYGRVPLVLPTPSFLERAA